MKQSKNWFFCSPRGARLIAVALALLSLSACKDDFGGYYNQPDYVSSSSDKVLESRSDCKTYLKLVNKTLFKKQIEGSGQYTFLVPTDDAFNAFFANNPYGYKNVDDIPVDVATRMVSSWMMYNSYPCDTLANVLQGFNSWSTNTAFKHRTPSYDVLREEKLDGKNYQFYEFANFESSFTLSNNAPSWHNYRYLPIFTARYNRSNGITSDDWKKVINSEFSEYGNYLQAGIIDAGSGSTNPGDLYCQNGVIHLVNKVVMPLENMDAIIRTYGDGSAVDQPENSKEGAWKILRQMLYHKSGDGNYCFFSLEENSTASHYFEKAYPEKNLENFRLRFYDTSKAPYSLNIENYLTMQNMFSTADCTFDNNNGAMTFYVPEKQVLLDYINNRLFKYIGVQITENTTQEEFDAAFNKLSENVIVTLWQTMQADGLVWPSQFESSAVNSVGSNEHINGYDSNVTYANSVKAAGMASNAMWQITNFVPKTSAFEGIASRFLLDPSFSIEEDLLTSTYKSSIYSNMLKSELSCMDDVNLNLILWGDANMKWWDNIHYSNLLKSYSNYVEGGGTKETDSNVSGYLRTNLLNGYIERENVDPLDLEVDPLNGAYGGWAYTNNYAGGVMRYRKSGKIIDGKPEIQIQTFWNLLNDANERELYGLSTLQADKVPAMLQATEPTEGSYASVVKDNSTEYVNGNVYLTTEHSVPLVYNVEGTFGDGTQFYNTYSSNLSYLYYYLMADANAENPQHTIFKKYFDYYLDHKSQKSNGEEIKFQNGNWTIFVPTDEALQYAIDYKKTNDDIELLRDPDKLPTDPTTGGGTVIVDGKSESLMCNWVDSVIYFINSYCTKSGCYPDDGLSAIYETSEAWDGVSGRTSRQAPSTYILSTNCKVTDMDRQGPNGIVKAWGGLISGATMSGIVSKTGEGNKLQYYGRPYTSGAYQVVDVYNANEIAPDKFDNTVVRQQGQSNIMGSQFMIHSLNGFIVYKIASH